MQKRVSSNGRAGFLPFHLPEHWASAASCCHTGKKHVCVFRWGPAVFRCNASCVADCTEKKAGFKQNRCGYVYSMSQLLYCSHIYIYSVLDICVRELLICMQFSCDSRSRVDPFIPGVLSCSRTTDTSKCFILSLFCSAFFCLFCKPFLVFCLAFEGDYTVCRWKSSLCFYNNTASYIFFFPSPVLKVLWSQGLVWHLLLTGRFHQLFLQ